jgi:hypothetical protein
LHDISGAAVGLLLVPSWSLPWAFRAGEWQARPHAEADRAQPRAGTRRQQAVVTMNAKHLQAQQELLFRAFDRLWQRSNDDAERNPGGTRFEVDQKLIADARLHSKWRPPEERRMGPRRAFP